LKNNQLFDILWRLNINTTKGLYDFEIENWLIDELDYEYDIIVFILMMYYTFKWRILMLENLHKKTMTMTALIVVGIAAVGIINFYSPEIYQFFAYIESKKEPIFTSFTLNFKYVVCFFIGSNIFLFLIGRNMYTWNENSNAKKVLDEKFKKISMVRRIAISVLAFTSILLSFGEFELLKIKAITVYSSIIITAFLISELYWMIYKWNMANQAASALSQSIDGRRSISKQKSEMIMKSNWSTPFGEKGHYYYNCDLSPIDNEWAQTGFKCEYK
jgi:hypothetical protein